MSTDALNAVVTDCVEALQRIGDLFTSDSTGQALLSRLGWSVSALPAPLLALGGSLRKLRPMLVQALATPDSPEVWISLSSQVSDLVAEIRDLENQSFGAELDAMGIGVQLAEQLLQWAALEQLDRRHPSLLAILRAVGIVHGVPHPAAAGRPPYLDERFALPDFGAVFTSPATLLRTAWAWGDPAFDGIGLLEELIAAFRTLGVPAGFVAVPPSQRELAEVDVGAIRWHMIARFLSGSAAGASYEVGLQIFNLLEDGDPALAVVPYLEGTLTEAVPFGDSFNLAIAGAASAGEGHALVISPSGIKFVTDLFGSATPAPASDISVTLQYKPTDSVEISLGLVAIKASGWSIKAAAFASEGAGSELAIEASLTDARIGLPVGSDGLLSSLFGSDHATIPLPLVLGVSSKRGIYVSPSGLTLDIALSLQLGPVEVRKISLKLDGVDRGIDAAVTVSVAANIGPLILVLDGLGASLDIRFPDSGGNLGVVDLGADFKLPSGVGLTVDAGGVSGGGFLTHDDTKHEYAGVLQLQFTELALQAFGLITTQVAGGNGYSLLAMIDADFQPIQLGWGFTLNGVGGLLAVHRTASVDALHAALKADKLGAILFPKNAITNAPQILAELDTLFPTAPGRFLFGPMALIGWGTPTLLTVALAVIIELPEPIRIILLARLAVHLPSESDGLVRINMDALGVLDLGQDSLSLDATLFDSRLLKFALSGDMALRANWGGQPREFLLSVGGFHPRFTPPTGFPTLKRMSIDMTAGSIAKVHLESYLAITSNTLQIGANLHVLIKVSAFSIDGHLGFDALFQRNPFHFDGDISGSVAVSIDGDDLLSVSLDAMLTGPAPWQISGSFKVHIIFVDVSKSFSHTWGDSDSSQQIAPVDVGALLNTELADPRSWGVHLAAGTPALISSRAVQNATGVVAHPLAQLEVHERTVPLGMDITRFGGAPVTGASNFAITDFRIGGTAVPRASVQDDFAAAQFLDLTDDEKLAQPSFELHDAGVRLSGGLVNSGAAVNKTITYETFYVDAPGGELRTDPATPPKQWQFTDLQAVLGTGSAGRATILSAGNRRYTAPGNPIQVADPAFVLVNADTLAPVGVGPASGSVYSNVQALMNQELKRDPSQQEHLQIVATHEMVAA